MVFAQRVQRRSISRPLFRLGGRTINKSLGVYFLRKVSRRRLFKTGVKSRPAFIYWRTIVVVGAQHDEMEAAQ